MSLMAALCARTNLGVVRCSPALSSLDDRSDERATTMMSVATTMSVTRQDGDNTMISMMTGESVRAAAFGRKPMVSTIRRFSSKARRRAAWEDTAVIRKSAVAASTLAAYTQRERENHAHQRRHGGQDIIMAAWEGDDADLLGHVGAQALLGPLLHLLLLLELLESLQHVVEPVARRGLTHRRRRRRGRLLSLPLPACAADLLLRLRLLSLLQARDTDTDERDEHMGTH
jgi:hypothetical protein